MMLQFWWGCRGNLKLITLGSERVNIFSPKSSPFTCKSDQFHISPAASSSDVPSHSMENLAFHTLLRWKMKQSHSHYLTYTFLFKRLGECTFLNLGVQGLKDSELTLNNKNATGLCPHVAQSVYGPAGISAHVGLLDAADRQVSPATRTFHQREFFTGYQLPPVQSPGYQGLWDTLDGACANHRRACDSHCCFRCRNELWERWDGKILTTKFVSVVLNYRKAPFGNTLRREVFHR